MIMKALLDQAAKPLATFYTLTIRGFVKINNSNNPTNFDRINATHPSVTQNKLERPTNFSATLACLCPQVSDCKIITEVYTDRVPILSIEKELRLRA